MAMSNRAEISFVCNPLARELPSARASTSSFDPVAARRVRDFHRSLPGYRPTPLLALNSLAADLGVANVWIKDESKRFGLNAFKVLGASYAAARAVADAVGVDAAHLTPDVVDDPTVRSRVKEITLCTATDGNHGRAVAWAAKRLGCRAVVYMPRGTSNARSRAVSSHGADVTVLDCSYDDAVRRAVDDSASNGWLLIQDTGWPGYEDIPRRIMQGYLTILDESLEQLHGQVPTHVLVQAGVGSLAGAIQGQVCELAGGARPVVAVVEPAAAACCYASMVAGTGQPQSVPVDRPTIMTGLACGTPSSVAWRILRDYTDVFVVCSDEVAEEGMRALARPSPGDRPLASGESGAVTAGLLVRILSPASKATYAELIEAMMLEVDSRILLLSTEGRTGPDTYDRIVVT